MSWWPERRVPRLLESRAAPCRTLVTARSSIWRTRRNPGSLSNERCASVRSSGEQVEVVSGVQPGDVVVTEGSFFVRAERERLGLRPAAAGPSATPKRSASIIEPTRRSSDAVQTAKVVVSEQGYEPAKVTLACRSTSTHDVRAHNRQDLRHRSGVSVVEHQASAPALGPSCFVGRAEHRREISLQVDSECAVGWRHDDGVDERSERLRGFGARLRVLPGLSQRRHLVSVQLGQFGVERRRLVGCLELCLELSPMCDEKGADLLAGCDGVSARWLAVLQSERSEHALATRLNDRRAADVLTEDLVSARDDVRICVYLFGSTDHTHQAPQRAKCCRIELRRLTQLRKGDPIGWGGAGAGASKILCRSTARRAASVAA